MAIGPITGIPAVTPPITPAATDATSSAPGASGFGEALARGLDHVAGLERQANSLIGDLAAGGQTPVHEVMIATAEASLATDMLVQIRDRALEAYHEIMRLQL